MLSPVYVSDTLWVHEAAGMAVPMTAPPPGTSRPGLFLAPACPLAQLD